MDEGREAGGGVFGFRAVTAVQVGGVATQAKSGGRGSMQWTTSELAGSLGRLSSPILALDPVSWVKLGGESGN